LPEQSVFYVGVDGAKQIEEEREDNNIAPFTVNLSASTLPNLTVDASDIVIDSASVQPGQPVSIMATIHNRGSVIGLIPVSIYLTTTPTGKVLLAERTIYQNISHGESATVQVTADTADLVGNCTVSVEIDPQNVIQESNENDNKAEGTFAIQSSNLTATLDIDKTLYSANETVAIKLALASSRSESRNVTVSMAVLKPDGTLVGTVMKDEAIALAPNGNVTKNAEWNTLGTYSGEHQIVAEIKENGLTVNRLSKDFVIGADQSLGARITSDKAGYNAHEGVVVTSTITSKTTNFIFKDLRGVVELKGPDQALILTKEQSIVTLMPKAVKTWNTLWNTSNSTPGTYTVGLKVYSGNSLLETTQSSFTVRSTANSGHGVTGTVVLTPSTVTQGQTSTMTYTIKNMGNTSLAGVTIRARVINPVSNAVISEYAGASEIGAGETITGSALIKTTGIAPGNYLAVVQIEGGGLTSPISVASGRIKIVAPSDPCARVTDGLLALYRYKEGSGTMVHDTSSVGSPLDLSIEDEYRVTWIKNGGLSTYVDTPILSQAEANKILSSWKNSGKELAIELWIRPATNDLNIKNGSSAPIVTILNNDTPVVTVSQYHSCNNPDVFKVDMNDGQGNSSKIVAPSGTLKTGLTHLVFTHDINGNARLYLNGIQIASGVTNFDLSSVTVKNSYVSLNEDIPAWEGDYFLMAIYNRALSVSEITMNLNACPPSPALRIPHRPVAVAGGPYIAYENETISVNADQSYDIDDGQSESDQPPFDALISYGWELQMKEPMGFDDKSGVQTDRKSVV
jgi:hypothetical protein